MSDNTAKQMTTKDICFMLGVTLWLVSSAVAFFIAAFFLFFKYIPLSSSEPDNPLEQLYLNKILCSGVYFLLTSTSFLLLNRYFKAKSADVKPEKRTNKKKLIQRYSGFVTVVCLMFCMYSVCRLCHIPLDAVNFQALKDVYSSMAIFSGTAAFISVFVWFMTITGGDEGIWIIRF